FRILGCAGETREAACIAAALVHDPDIVRVRERDLRLADGWRTEHARLRMQGDRAGDERGQDCPGYRVRAHRIKGWRRVKLCPPNEVRLEVTGHWAYLGALWLRSRTSP